MHKQVTCTTLMFLLAAPALLVAQQSGTARGQFGTRTFATQTTEMPDGRMVDVSHYHQVTFADDASHPLNNQTADCVGQFLMSADGDPLAASGSCYGRDTDGDGVSFWWRMDEAGTTDCPNMCGSFGYFAGFGKFEGITGSGTWRVTAPFAEGNLGIWEGSYSMK